MGLLFHTLSSVPFFYLLLTGLRYILSGGDNKKITDAKNTILYAIIGLIIAVLAFAIVNFVLNAIGGTVTDADTAAVFLTLRG